LKWWKNTSKTRKKLQPYYEIYQFGRTGWIGLSNLGEEEKRLAKDGLEFSEKVVKEKTPHLLILDEINLALHCDLLEPEEVLDLLNRIPKKTDVVLTGRYAPKELMERADFINEVKDIKHPKTIPTTKGIQY